MTITERAEAAKAHIVAALENYRLESRGFTVPPRESMELVGSTYISDAENRDIDILVCIPGVDLDPMYFDGWQYGGSVGMGNDHSWMSWKTSFPDCGEVNMLITNKQEYKTLWLTAAEVCRFIFLKGITLPTAVVHGIHEIIMDDSTAETEALHRTY